MFNYVMFDFLSAAFQEKKIINDIANIQIISDFSRFLLTIFFLHTWSDLVRLSRTQSEL